MRTRSQARKRRQQQVQQTSVEPPNLEKPTNNPPIVTMADNRTMAQLLEAPTEGYEDAIVIPEITANNFEIKHGLLNLVQNKQFFGNDKEDPHAHVRYFNKITSTMKIPNVPNTLQLPVLELFLVTLLPDPKGKNKKVSLPEWCTIHGPTSVNHDAEVTKGTTMPPANKLSINDDQASFVQIQSRKPTPNPEPNVFSSFFLQCPKVSILFLREENMKTAGKKLRQIEKFYEIFKRYELSKLALDALTLCLNSALTLKALIGKQNN
ncbi:hypothetical protein Tco_0367276 [Tanacetum coccineum]